MTSPNAEASPLVYARVAGLLYLIIIVFGIFDEAFVRARLVVPGDAAATAENILTSEWLFRIGFVGDTIVFFADVAVAIILYVLLKPVSKPLAMMAAAFRLTQTAVLGLNLLNHYAALLILSGAGYLTAFDADQRNALALLAMEAHSHGYDLALLFFGMSCLVLGYLVVKSDYFPAILGYLLAAGGVVYLIGSYTLFLFPTAVDTVAPIYIVALIAELAFCLWLLVKGVRTQPATAMQE